jgi:hypothetical protein
MLDPKVNEDLFAYTQWRSTLVPISVGAIVCWIDEKKYTGSTQRADISKGQCFKVIKVREPLFRKPPFVIGDMVYDMVQCSKTGKEYKKIIAFSIEGIARFIENKQMEIL